MAELSRALFKAAQHPESPSTIVSKTEKLVKRRRDSVLGNLCQAIKKDGKWLYSHPDDGGQHALQASFSKHGSVYHRLHLKKINDIDIYVILYGAGLTYRGSRLLPRPDSVPAKDNPNARAFGASSADHELGDSIRAVQWMIRMVHAAIPANAHHKIRETPGRRGAVLLNYGQKGRVNFDFIPVFVAKGDTGHFHVLPDGRGGWEYNPTDRIMRMVDEYHALYPRYPEQKVLGVKDIIKVLKVFKTQDHWESRHGVSSFVILCAADKLLQDPGLAGRFKEEQFNQKRIQMVLDQINMWISQGGFADPYTGKRLVLRGSKIQLTDQLMTRFLQLIQ